MTNSLSAELSPSTAVVVFVVTAVVVFVVTAVVIYVVTAIVVALVAYAVVVQKQLDGSGGELK